MKRKNVTKLILTLLILSSFTTYGQAKKKNERDTTKQWEIGLDLLWLINKNQVPSTSLFTRYNFVNKENQKRAWRFRLGVDNSAYDSAQITETRDNEIDIIAPYIRMGYEWQKDVSERVSFFYGVDVSGLYSQYKAKIIYYVPIRLLQETDKTWEFGIIPFIGFKYKPVNWLSISTESSFNFIYRVRRQKSKFTDLDFPNDPGSNGKIDINELKMSFLPITVINLSFYLNKK